MKGIRTAEKLIFLCCYTSTVDLFFFFFFLRRGNLHGHQATSGGEWRGSAGLQPTKTSTMTTRLRSKEAREPVRATQRAPHAHKMHRLRGRRTRQSDSPTGLPGGPEELIYQHLTLTPTGGNGGPGAPCPSVPATSAAPPPVDPLGVGAPHPHSFRCLLPKHNLLTEGGHGPPPSLARQQCRENRL